MQPEEPAPNYDFIMNPQSPKKPLFSLGGSTKSRAMILIGGLLIFVIILWVVFAILGNASKGNVEQLVGLAQRQQEIARVADQASLTSRQAATKNLAQTTALSMRSSQKQLVDAIKKHGRKVNAKELALKQSLATDTTLKSANEANNYDQVFVKTIGQALTDYRQAINATFPSTSSIKDKQLLNTMYAQAGLLLQQTD